MTNCLLPWEWVQRGSCDTSVVDNIQFLVLTAESWAIFLDKEKHLSSPDPPKSTQTSFSLLPLHWRYNFLGRQGCEIKATIKCGQINTNRAQELLKYIHIYWRDGCQILRLLPSDKTSVWHELSTCATRPWNVPSWPQLSLTRNPVHSVIEAMGRHKYSVILTKSVHLTEINRCFHFQSQVPAEKCAGLGLEHSHDAEGGRATALIFHGNGCYARTGKRFDRLNLFGLLLPMEARI